MNNGPFNQPLERGGETGRQPGGAGIKCAKPSEPGRARARLRAGDEDQPQTPRAGRGAGTCPCRARPSSALLSSRRPGREAHAAAATRASTARTPVISQHRGPRPWIGPLPSPRPLGPRRLQSASTCGRRAPVPLRADGPRAGPAKALSALLSRAVQRSRVQDSHLLVSRPWMDAGLLPPLTVSGPFGPDASSAAESSLGDAVLAPKLLPTRQDARRMVRAVGGAERAGRRRGAAGLAGSPPEPSPC